MTGQELKDSLPTVHGIRNLIELIKSVKSLKTFQTAFPAILNPV